MENNRERIVKLEVEHDNCVNIWQPMIAKKIDEVASNTKINQEKIEKMGKDIAVVKSIVEEDKNRKDFMRMYRGMHGSADPVPDEEDVIKSEIMERIPSFSNEERDRVKNSGTYIKFGGAGVVIAGLAILVYLSISGVI